MDKRSTWMNWIWLSPSHLLWNELRLSNNKGYLQFQTWDNCIPLMSNTVHLVVVFQLFLQVFPDLLQAFETQMAECSWDLPNFQFVYPRKTWWQSDLLELYNYFKPLLNTKQGELQYTWLWILLQSFLQDASFTRILQFPNNVLTFSGDHISVSHVWILRAKVSPIFTLVTSISWWIRVRLYIHII